MALLGAEQAQEQLQSLIMQTISPLIDESKKITLEEAKSIERIFVEKLQALISGCEEPAKLNLDKPLDLNSKIQINFPHLLQSLNFNLANEAILRLQAKFNFQYMNEPQSAENVLLSNGSPSQLYKKGKLLQDNYGQFFIFKQALGGRGQAGSASFYQKANQQFLIKEDTAETCLLEGTAYFVKEAHALPNLLSDAVNFATVATLATEDNVTQTVSVQPRVMSSHPSGSVCPWDELVYGLKRNPKTIWSFESWYPDYISRSISALNSIPQWELAASMVACNIAGDESLHVGQYMAILDDHKKIIGIKRIDLGARERSSLQRQLNHELSPYHASLLYQESIWKGKQMGKDYISYLLDEPNLKRKFNFLWVNMGERFKQDGELAKVISEKSKAAFIAQYKALPEEHKEHVLGDVLATINKGAKQPLVFPTDAKLNEKLLFLAENIAQLDVDRTLAMLEQAKIDFKVDTEAFLSLASSKIEGNQQPAIFEAIRIRDCYLQGKEDDQVEKVLQDLDNAIQQSLKMAEKHTQDKLSYEQIKIYAQAALIILDAVQLSMMDDVRKKSDIEMRDVDLKKYATLLQAANYCASTSSVDKIADVVGLMKEVSTKKENEFTHSLQDNIHLIAKLSTQKNITSSVIGSVVTQRTKGFYLLQNIFRRYGLDDSLLVLTPAQVNLKNQIMEKNFKNVKNIVSSSAFAINDVLAPNVDGSTNLHLLMQYADNADAFEAIAQIMLKSRGTVYNSNLAPLDVNQEQPLDYLLKNQHAQVLLAYLKAKKYEIPGLWGSTKYQITDFFTKEKIDEIETKISEQKKRLSL